MPLFSKIPRSTAELADAVKYLIENIAGPAAPSIRNGYRLARNYIQRAVSPSKMTAPSQKIDWSKVKSEDDPFMTFSTCSAADILHPQFLRIMNDLATEPAPHRKLWEYAYIIYHLEQSGVLKNEARGIGFGVGVESIPALLASRGCEVTATDAPFELAKTKGWQLNDEYASEKERLYRNEILDRQTFEQRVRIAPCDMTAIDPNLSGFDFCWSSCAFEHLGSLRAGMDFVKNSLATLRPGGVAVHTTEFNLSSNERTFDGRTTAIYRRRDIEQLTRELRDGGHEVSELRIAPDSHELDTIIDAPPYHHNPHLRLKLAGYITTSVGITIRKAS